MGSDGMGGGENAVVDNPDAQMLDAFPWQSGNDSVSLTLFCPRKTFNEGFQFSDGEVLFEENVRDAKAVKKIKKGSEMDLFALVEASLQEQSVFRHAQKEKITVFHRFEDLAVKRFDILLEKLMTARVELSRLDGAHESGHKLLHAARQGVMRFFALVRAHPYPGCHQCSKNSANRICDSASSVNCERTAGCPLSASSGLVVLHG